MRYWYCAKIEDKQSNYDSVRHDKAMILRGTLLFNDLSQLEKNFDEVLFDMLEKQDGTEIFKNDKIVAELAAMEHKRWMIRKCLNGFYNKTWDTEGITDSSLKPNDDPLHNQFMVSYDEQADNAYDENSVKVVLEHKGKNAKGEIEK